MTPSARKAKSPMDDKPEAQEEEKERKPGVVFLAATACLVALGARLKYAENVMQDNDSSFAIGGAVGMALISSVARRLCHPRSRTRIVFWTSIVVLFRTLAAIGSICRARIEAAKSNLGPGTPRRKAAG
jgi:hypothetical protein